MVNSYFLHSRIDLSNGFERDNFIASNNLGYDDTANIVDDDVSVAGLRVTPSAGGRGLEVQPVLEQVVKKLIIFCLIWLWSIGSTNPFA